MICNPSHFYLLLSDFDHCLVINAALHEAERFDSLVTGEIKKMSRVWTGEDRTKPKHRHYFANRANSRITSSRNGLRLGPDRDTLLIVADLKFLVVKKPRGNSVSVEDPAFESVHSL